MLVMAALCALVAAWQALRRRSGPAVEGAI
jgi:hypothetical protein